MKILGYEITKSNDAQEPQAPPVKASTHKTNKKISRKMLSGELGDPGTEIYDGYISEEYNAELRAERGVKMFDKMNKSDGTVRSVTRATSLPIRRATWLVATNGEDAQAEEMREFVEKNLFEFMEITWDDFLRQALLMLTYGVMPFEIVFEARNWEGRDYITWKKFAPRDPKTIQSWELDSGETGIQQIRRDGEIAEIPMEKMLVFVNEKEGENWWGTSILRPAYKHWDMKNKFYKIDAIAFERQGIGVPYAKMPKSYSSEDENRAKKILKSMRAHHNAHVIIPHDYEVGYLDMNSNSTRDPEKSIAHHNREITKSALAQFLELGSTESGSRALSTDQSDMFLKSLEAAASNIADVFNKYAIKQLIDLNYDNVEDYPFIDFTDIQRADAKSIAEAYNVLSQSGGIQKTEKDEDFFRGLLGLPELSQEDREEREQQEEDEDDDMPTPPEDNDNGNDDGDVEASENSKKKDVSTLVKEKYHQSGHNRAATIDFIQNMMADTEKGTETYSQLNEKLIDYKKEVSKVRFQEGNDFEGWRPLTFAEEKVNLQSIQNTLDRVQENYEKEATKLLEEEKKRYVKQVSKAILDEDHKAIENATFQVTTKYKKIVKDNLKRIYEFGKSNAAREMGEKTPPNRRETLRHIDINANAIVEDHINSFKTRAKTAIVEAIRKPDSKEEFAENKSRAVGALGDVLTKQISNKVRNTSNIVFAAFLNNGRQDTFETYPDKIYALQRSEILDRKTCNYCISVDGRIVEKDDPFASNTVFHSSCRGIWVEILTDEQEKPEIGGVPESLRARFGGSVNELIQPKTPQPVSEEKVDEIENQ